MTEPADRLAPATPAVNLFGDRTELASRYVALLREHGTERGLIGPRETERLWDRHVLNSAVLEELIPHGARVVDVGSGAGLPGVPLAIARPDLDIVLLEPMARRVAWLHEVAGELELPVTVVRGRAEDRAVRDHVAAVDVVTARALAPLGKLCGWCIPLARLGGAVLAMKGASAADEVARDRDVMRATGARNIRVATCGSAWIAEPATVVSMDRQQNGSNAPRSSRSKAGTRSKRGKT